jgi:hypothetical protein
MRRFSIAFIFLISIIACNNNRSELLSEKIQLPGDIEIQMPKGSKVTDSKGIDSYTGYLITPSNDTFEVEFGDSRIIYDLRSSTPLIVGINERDSFLKNTGSVPPPDQVIFSQNVEQDMEQNVFDRQFYFYDSSNSLMKKIVQPKTIGNGITGVYVHGLANNKAMSIFARNLDSVQHQMAIQAFKSIKKNK